MGCGKSKTSVAVDSSDPVDAPQAILVEPVLDRKDFAGQAVFAEPLPHYYNPMAGGYGTWDQNERLPLVVEQSEMNDIAMVICFFVLCLVCFVLFFIPWQDWYDDDYS